MKQKAKDMEDKVVTVSEKASDNSRDKVLQEMSDRASRERMYSCPESRVSVLETARSDDFGGIQDLLAQLGFGDLDAKKALLRWRRLAGRRRQQ